MGNNNAETIDPTKPLSENGSEKQENNRNPSWFKPGESGNPHGRPPKGHSITETFKQMLGAKIEIKQALVNKTLRLALDGDITAIRLIWNYMDGLPLQATDITTLGEKLPDTKTIILDTKPKEENG